MPLTWKIQPTPSVIEVPTKLNDKLENGTENNNAPASASGLVSQNSSLSRRNASFMSRQASATRYRWEFLIISPSSTAWVLWNYFTVFCALLTGFVEPFKIAFLPNPGGFPGPGRDFWDNQDYILTTIFMVDVMLRFTVANTKNAETEILARDHRTIALNYVRGIFLFDLLFCMPIDWIVEAAVQAAYPYDYGNVYAAANGQLLLWVSTIKFIKMGRMYRVLLFFNNLDKKMVLSEIALMLIRNWLYVLYSSHWGACIFYLIARLEMFSPQSWVGRAQNRMDGTSTADRYIYSLYVSMSVFIGSLGDNDFYEASVAEAAFMILYCLLNVVLSAYILGTVTMLMVKFDERSKALRDKKTNLIAFKKMHDISDDLYIAMKEHLELHFHSEQTADENVLSVYPATLRRKVLRELYMENLKACYLFGSSKAKFLDAILAIARVELFLPYVELIQQGDIVQELYIVMEGEVQVLVRQMGGLEKGPDQSFVASKKSFKAIASQVSGALAFAKKSIYGAPLELSNSQNIKSTTLNIVNATETRYAAETFGEVSFFTEMPSPEGAMTAISSRIMVISKSEFEGLSTVFPNATRAVLDALLTRTEEDLEFELEAVAPTYRTAIIRKFSNFLLPTEKIKLEPGDLDPEVCDKIVSELNPSQVLKLEMLSRINKAVKHHYEQLDLSRVSKLLNHVAKNNTTDVKRMLSQGLNPDTCAHHDKRTALMIAASEGHLAMCQLLLDSGANPMARDRFERTPLLDAVQLGHDNIILLLRKYRATLRGDSLLAAGEMLNAVCSGDIVLLRRYLRAGADPDAMDCDSRTALHLAASEGDVKLTRLLIEEGGATVDLKDRWGHTPLDNARMFNIQPMIDYLGPIMEASVQLRATTVEHARVAKWLGAASVGNLSLMNKMLKEQVDPNISCKANGGRTAMMLAATEGHEEIVLRLLEANARVDICDDSGCSLLFHAAHACREDLVNMLVDRGVTLFMNDQLVAYHMCTAAKGNYAFLRCLIKAGADPKIPLMGASSPLHCAAAADCVKSLRVLVEEGHISPDTRSPHGTTALYEAQAAGALKAVKYLNRALGTDPLISPVWPAGKYPATQPDSLYTLDSDHYRALCSIISMGDDSLHGKVTRPNTSAVDSVTWSSWQHSSDSSSPSQTCSNLEHAVNRDMDWKTSKAASQERKVSKDEEDAIRSSQRRRASWFMLHSGKVEDSSDSQSPDYRMQQAQTSQRPQQVPRLCLTSRHLGEGIATHHPPSAHSALPVAAVDQGAASQPVVKAVVLTSDHASDSLKGNQTLTDILNLASTPKGLSKLSYQSDSAGSLHKTSTVLHVSDSPVAASPQNSSSGRSLLSRGSGSGTAVAAARDAVAAAASEMLTARDIELGVLQTERQDINLIGDQRVVPSAHTPHGLKLGMTDLASSSSYQGPQLSRFATQDAQATGVAMLSQIHEKGASSEDAVEPLTAAELQPSLGTGLQIEVYTAPAGEGMKVEDAEEDLVGLSGSSITNIEAMVMSLKSLPSRKSQAGRAP